LSSITSILSRPPALLPITCSTQQQQLHINNLFVRELTEQSWKMSNVLWKFTSEAARRR
jgi:hypothetical protein